MKNLILSFLITVSSLTVSAKVKPDSVWLCMGPYSHSYHNTEYCKGLTKCSTKLKKVSLDDAINKYHRKACHYCYK